MTDKPGVYDIPEAEYHADPCVEPSLSSSIAKVLLNQSPRHAWTKHPRLNPAAEAVNRKDFDLGSAAHALLLEGNEPFVIIAADSYRTNAAKEQRDAAYAAGKIPLLTDQANAVHAMAAAAAVQMKGHADAFNAFAGGKPEQTLIWREGAAWCRARLDWLPDDGAIIWDYKSTTDANPDAWQRRLFDLGFDVQAAFYLRGVRAVLGIENPGFRFIVQETTAPYALSINALTPAAMTMAEVKVERALSIWRWCMEHDRWPGYPKETCYIEPPPWELSKFEEMKARDEAAREDGKALVEQMIAWQRPLEREAS